MTLNNSQPEKTSTPHLRESARKGVVWLTGSRLVEQAITFLITLLLARLLTPADYGLLGMATLVLTFLGRFADFGTAEAIVQMREIDDERLSSLFWFNLALGLLFGLLMILLAPVMANFFREPSVQPVIVVLAVALPLQAVVVVPEFLLRRRMQFNQLVVRSLAAILIAGVAGLAVAFAGGGVWALVTQQLVAPLVSGVALWAAAHWRPQFHFRRQHIGEIRDFTTGVLGFNLLNYFGRNIDYLLIGRFLSPTDLGLYTLAYRLMRYPTQFLSSTASQALFPVFSRMQNDPVRLGTAYVQISRFISLAAMPVLMGMAVTAGDLIAALYGPQWLPAAPLLAFLAIAGILQPVTVLFTSVAWAQGLSQWQLRYAVVQTLIIVAGFVIGLQWGIVGMAASYMVTSLISNGITILLMFPRCGISRRAFGAAIALPLGASLAMAVAVLGVRATMNAAGYFTESAIMRLVVEIAVGGMVYFAIVLWRDPAALTELRIALGGKRSAKNRLISPETTAP